VGQEAAGATESPGLSALRAAAADWRRGRPGPLGRWLVREIEPGGFPARLPVPEWMDCLAVLDDARGQAESAWPAEFDARIEGFFLQVLRFCRPGGVPVFGPAAAVVDGGTGGLLGRWADRLSDPGLKTVVDWWFPARTRHHAPPPLPAAAHSEAPLAALRADWSARGDFLAIDHRAPGPASRFELFGLGQAWLGPSWTAGEPALPAAGGRAARPRLVRWESNSSADLAEWSFVAGSSRVVRSALLLRGRRLALLADQVDGPDPHLAMRLGIHEPLVAEPASGDHSIAVSAGPRRPNARLVPLALPFRSLPTDKGSFQVEGREVVLRQRKEVKRAWAPLLVSWDALRNRKTLLWRSLTVTQRGRICTEAEAAAYRVAWGRDESLVVYRSLDAAAPRAFLGHQTTARLLVGLFNRDGEVEPILKLEE
jgi:hypothetical protein